MKRAFFVLGAQGSGTRMLTQAFIAAGCRGSAEHQQPMDDLNFEGEGDLVFRRSLPHGGEWPDLVGIATKMKECGFEVVPLFIQRKTDFLVAHQLRTDRTDDQGNMVVPYAVDSEQVKSDLKFALALAMSMSNQIETTLRWVPYELFVGTPAFRMQLFASWGLFNPCEMTFYNANEHPCYSEVKALPW